VALRSVADFSSVVFACIDGGDALDSEEVVAEEEHGGKRSGGIQQFKGVEAFSRGRLRGETGDGVRLGEGLGEEGKGVDATFASVLGIAVGTLVVGTAESGAEVLMRVGEEVMEDEKRRAGLLCTTVDGLAAGGTFGTAARAGVPNPDSKGEDTANTE